jgi:hypothetical protein
MLVKMLAKRLRSGFLHCAAHDKTVSSFGRNDGLLAVGRKTSKGKGTATTKATAKAKATARTKTAARTSRTSEDMQRKCAEAAGELESD